MKYLVDMCRLKKYASNKNFGKDEVLLRNGVKKFTIRNKYLLEAIKFNIKWLLGATWSLISLRGNFFKC